MGGGGEEGGGINKLSDDQDEHVCRFTVRFMQTTYLIHYFQKLNSDSRWLRPKELPVMEVR